MKIVLTLGSLYNAQSCRECHQDPTSGGASQVTELRVGHLGPDGRFRNPAIPIARGTGKAFHPFGDFLLHDVGTGDGIVIPVEEHYGRAMSRVAWRSFSYSRCEESRNKVRTAPLWGLRLRTRLMHDGASVRLSDAIRRHRREAGNAARRFERLSKADREALLEFPRSL